MASITTLADLGYLEGNSKKQIIGFKGEALLHEIWPDLFPSPVQDGDLPF